MDFEKILAYAVKNEVSDIHLTPNLPVFFRLHGELEIVGENITDGEIQNLAAQILPEKQQMVLQEKRTVDFAYTSRNNNRFRGNFYFTREGLVLALRLIPNRIPDFSELGLPDFVLDNVMQLKNGLVLLVGPTGHGKSTTLASMVKHRSATNSEHIITLEDPIEFLIKSNKSVIHQRSLGRDVVSFSNGLKSALREDPDVLLVGEMRDLDTISAALTAAETGHLVLSTLHTKSAPETINRIIDAFPTDQQSQIRAQLSSALEMVIAQRLLPNKNNDGRVLAYETMTTNYAIKNHIRKGTVYQISNAMQTDGSGNMVLFDQSLAKLIMEQKITEKTAYANAISEDQVKYILEMNNYKYEDDRLEMANNLS